MNQYQIVVFIKDKADGKIYIATNDLTAENDKEVIENAEKLIGNEGDQTVVVTVVATRVLKVIGDTKLFSTQKHQDN